MAEARTSRSPRLEDYRGAVAGVAGSCTALAIVLTGVGAVNPWNLVVVDRVFMHPIIAGFVVIAGVGVVWHLYVVLRWLRWVGFGLLALCTAVWLCVGLLVMMFGDVTEIEGASERYQSPHNDVEVIAKGRLQSWDIWLNADRGFWSRENRVASIGAGDSYPPAITVEFTASDEVTIESNGHEVFRLRFDPHDLRAEEVRCLDKPEVLATCSRHGGN